MDKKDKFIELAFEGERLCKSGDYPGGIECFKSALKLGTDDLTTLSAIYSQLGNGYVFVGDFAQAVLYHQHDKTLAKTIGDLVGEAKANSNLASTFKMMGNFGDAISCSQTHLDIARKLSNKVSEAKALYNMANIYHVKGKHKCKTTCLSSSSMDPEALEDLNIAIKFYTKNLSIVQELGDRAAQGKACGSLGNIYYLLGNCNEAVKYHSERLAIAKEFGDKPAQRRAFANLGNTHVLLGKFQVASEYYLQTVSISRQLGDRAFEAQACYSLGSTYTLLGDYKRAIEYHLRHKQIAVELNDRVGVGRACWLLSNAHMSLGSYSKALEFAKEQLQISSELGDLAGKDVATKNVQKLTNLVEQSKSFINAETSKKRRASMENMELLRLTPEQVKMQHTNTEKYNGRSVSLFPDENTQADIENGNHRNESANGHLNGQPSILNSNDVDVEISNNGSEKFFDLLSRVQCRRMDDQRAEMRNDEEALLNLPEFLQQQLQHRQAQVIQQQEAEAAELEADQRAEENHEKMNHMISMLARSQSKRLNEQRVSLSSLPGLRINDDSLPLTQEVPAIADPLEANGGPNMVADGRLAEPHPQQSLDENFFDNLIRCQGTRLNDQRSSGPSADAQVQPSLTIPDEDFFSLIVRMQSSRIDDQRCRFEPVDG